MSRGGGPLRVCLVSATLPLGGAETLQLELLSGLDRSRFRAEAICLRDGGDMAPRFEAAGVPVHVMGRRRLQHLLTPAVLAAELRRRRTDVVLVTTHHAALFIAPLAARLAGAATVLGLHQIGGKRIGIPSLPPGGVELLRLIDALVLLTPAQYDYLVAEEGLGRFPWRRVRRAVIPNGIRIGPAPGPPERAEARRRLGLGEEELVVGIVAALRAEKAHDLFLRACARLVPGHPRLRPVLIGSGPTEASLRELAARLGIADRVVFTGYRDDVARLLPGLDVKCLTSVQETYPVSVLEAMAAGLPVVMTDPEGVPEIVRDGETGYVVPVGDEDALADRLHRLLDDPGLRARMGADGRRRAETEFPLSRTIRRYEELFTRLARRRGVGPRRGR